ncbi:MFS transporter [Herbiconiux sp. YIM B11900]|uniref:MFS transporter n=1 Tax=Herbiconiux sp. YIM B11900 TaxID=3404131 RepID=UPI003F8780F6
MTDTLTRRQLTAWRNAIFAIFALSGFSIASWIARLPAVRDLLQIDTAQVGVLILMMSIGAILGLIAAPHVMGRWGARAGMLLCLMLIAVATAVIGLGATLTGSAVVVGAGLALFGFGNGAVDVMMNVEGAAVERSIGKTVLPLMHAFFSFGTVTGAGIGALASALSVSVGVHLSVIAVLIVASALAAIRFVPRGAEAAAPTEPASDADADARALAATGTWGRRLRASLSVWTDVRLLAIGVIMLGMAFAEGSANDWLALAVVDGFSTDNTLGAVVFGVFTVAMTAGRIAGGPLLDRFGRVPVLRTGAILGFLGILAFIIAPTLWIGVVGVVFWALGCSLGFPVGMSAAADAPDPKSSAARVSAVAIIGYVAFLVGPPVIGLLGHDFGIRNALLLVLVLVALAGLASPAARELTGPRARVRADAGAGVS